MKYLTCLWLCIWLVAAGRYEKQDVLFIGDHGKIRFTSEAPLEIISAHSDHLRGVIDPSNKSFAFTVNISSFEGFNSDMQRIHFLENYMEQKKYTVATFKGKIIEDIPLSVPGKYSVRAKGELDIHGVKKERILKGSITVTEESMHVASDFSLPLVDHGIAIPKIVKQKIAEEVHVRIDIELVPRSRS